MKLFGINERNFVLTKPSFVGINSCYYTIHLRKTYYVIISSYALCDYKLIFFLQNQLCDYQMRFVPTILVMWQQNIFCYICIDKMYFVQVPQIFILWPKCICADKCVQWKLNYFTPGQTLLSPQNELCCYKDQFCNIKPYSVPQNCKCYKRYSAVVRAKFSTKMDTC